MSDIGTDSITVIGPRRRGRPRALEQTATLRTRLPEDEYDKLIRLADRRGESVSEVARKLLVIRLRDVDFP